MKRSIRREVGQQGESWRRARDEATCDDRADRGDGDRESRRRAWHVRGSEGFRRGSSEARITIGATAGGAGSGNGGGGGGTGEGAAPEGDGIGRGRSLHVSGGAAWGARAASGSMASAIARVTAAASGAQSVAWLERSRVPCSAPAASRTHVDVGAELARVALDEPLDAARRVLGKHRASEAVRDARADHRAVGAVLRVRSTDPHETKRAGCVGAPIRPPCT